jgi:hypothetical protein
MPHLPEAPPERHTDTTAMGRRERAGYLDDIAAHTASARPTNRPHRGQRPPWRAEATQNGPRATVRCVCVLSSPHLSASCSHMNRQLCHTARRRDDTTTATENDMGDIQTPEPSQQRDDDAGMRNRRFDANSWTCEGAEDECNGAQLRGNIGER